MRGMELKIVREHIFSEEAKPFTGFTEGCQKGSVSPMLLALVNMILEGPAITDVNTFLVKRPNHLLDLQRAAKKVLYHRCY